jgi:hypothetical protein
MSVLIVANGLVVGLFVFVAFTTGYRYGLKDQAPPEIPFLKRMSEMINDVKRGKEQEEDDNEKVNRFYD